MRPKVSSSTTGGDLQPLSSVAIGADGYLEAIVPLIQNLGDQHVAAAIQLAAQAAADALSGGGKIWLTPTSHCLHSEATYRAGGLMAVHILNDPVLVRRGDCVIEGTPVGTSGLAIDCALNAKARGATLVALTNVAFENDSQTILEHPTERRLHQIADIVVDLSGPIGDGIFSHPDTEEMRVIPHSGVTGMVAMWMILSEAVSLLLARGEAPRFYECIMIEGASERNNRERDAYLTSGSGVTTREELDHQVFDRSSNGRGG